jgi:hypothetical protein
LENKAVFFTMSYNILKSIVICHSGAKIVKRGLMVV